MSTLYLITGSCPRTEASLRLELAELADADGRGLEAQEWRDIVAKMRTQWSDAREQTKVALGFAVQMPDPDAPVPPIGTDRHPMFWHAPRRDDTMFCECGHFSGYLCDEPVGKGRTCDKAMCECCRIEVGPDIDLCRFHAETRPREMVPAQEAQA